MSKTILITGASTGIGRATAEHFAEKGWNVIATMRKPNDEDDLCQRANVLCEPLDVTDRSSIRSAMQAAHEQFGSIDVVVNNAGYGTVGPLEFATREQLQQQFDVNVFGLVAVIQEALPYMREQRSGTIINISSMGGRITFPLYSAYHGTKWAVEGISESLQYELDEFNIRVKLVEPGAIKTDFYSRSQERFDAGENAAYAHMEKRFASMQKAGDRGDTPASVARIVFRAATDGSTRLRYPAGGGAKWILALARILPFRLFRALIKRATH